MSEKIRKKKEERRVIGSEPTYLKDAEKQKEKNEGQE